MDATIVYNGDDTDIKTKNTYDLTNSDRISILLSSNTIYSNIDGCSDNVDVVYILLADSSNNEVDSSMFFVILRIIMF